LPAAVCSTLSVLLEIAHPIVGYPPLGFAGRSPIHYQTKIVCWELN
jgi:hypothetical protein